MQVAHEIYEKDKKKEEEALKLLPVKWLEPQEPEAYLGLVAVRGTTWVHLP